MAVVARGGGVAALAGALDALAAAPSGRAVVVPHVSQPTPASAEVVHEVVDLLSMAGCSEVVVGVALRGRDRDRGHASSAALARQARLLGRTGRGGRYDVVDLDADQVPAPVGGESVLSGHTVSEAWSGADTRVVVGRAVTDLFDGYAGCLLPLLGAASEVAGAQAADVVADLLAALPPTLAVVDALAVSDGPDGAHLPAPQETGTLVVARDALLADHVLAALLGEDRSASALVRRAVERFGAPVGRVDGDLSPWPDVRLGHPACRAAAARTRAEPRLARVVSAAVGGPDAGASPADPVLAAARAVLTPVVESAGEPAGQAVLVAMLESATSLARGYLSFATGLAKDHVERRVVPLGFDAAAHGPEEYDRLPAFFAPFADLLEGLPENDDGMRWRLVDGATVFEVARDVAADFDEFVARVDVAAGISLMADYLGGRRVPVSTTPDGSRTHQVERNLYLPQPNYLSLWGGQPIDVCKIELVERMPDEHRLTWRTVHSPNGSAAYDDGTLTFTRTPLGTRAVVRGRQLFSLPPAWSGVDLADVPELRNPLLEDAYRRFFTTTFDNLEACFEGREFRIGRPPAAPDEPLLTESLGLLLDAGRGWLSDHGVAPAGRTPAAPRTLVDSRGFTHVPGPR